MATWEPKLPSFHETSSLWPLKSSAAATAAGDHHHWSTTSGSPAPAASPPPGMADRPLLTSLANSSPSPSPPPPSSSRQFTTSSKMEHPLDVFHSEFPGGEAAGSGSYAANSSSPATSRGNATKSSPLLAASGAVGTGSTKVAKKRARASRKPPTTVLEADSSNFRAMVQQLTGIPAVPFLSSSIHQRNSLDFLDVGMRPPTATRSLLGFGPQSLQGLPPLDPSALLPPPFASRDHTAGLSSSPSYFKYLPGGAAAAAAAAAHPPLDHSRSPQTNPSMGDFLRTPLDELGLDHHQAGGMSSLDPSQHEQKARKMESLSMPLLWDQAGDGGATATPSELQLEDISKYKIGSGSSTRTDDPQGDAAGGDDASEPQDGSSSRIVHIVDSWLSGHADQATTDKH